MGHYWSMLHQISITGQCLIAMGAIILFWICGDVLGSLGDFQSIKRKKYGCKDIRHVTVKFG